MPTTIGPFTNVPAPGDPITSPWAQQLTQWSVDAPRGLRNQAFATAPQIVGMGGWTDLTGLSVPITAVAGRTYRISGIVPVQKKTAAGDVFVGIWLGASQVGGAMVTLAPNAYATLPILLHRSGLTGAVTVQLKLFASTDNVTTATSAQYPAYLIVDDTATTGFAPPVVTTQPADAGVEVEA
jgi:hypothetical protein